MGIGAFRRFYRVKYRHMELIKIMSQGMMGSTAAPLISFQFKALRLLCIVRPDT